MPCSPPKNWGYSHKIGPVYLSDREDTISPKKKDEIEDEVRRYVIIPCDLLQVPAPPPIPYVVRRYMSLLGDSRGVYGGQHIHRLTGSVLVSLLHDSLLIAGESRVAALLKSNADELHRVR